MLKSCRYAIYLVCMLMMMSASLAPVLSAEAESGPYPRHVDLATLGTVLGMRGQTASENGLPVRFASSDVASLLVEPEFKYEGFFLHQILISKIATIAGQPDSWRVGGVLVFEDAAGRRAYAQYSTYYRVLNDGIEITRTVARAFTPTEPTIVWFAVRQEDVPREMLTPENHAELIKLAATQSLERVPLNADDYVVFALSMDRIAPSEQMAFGTDLTDMEVTSVNLGGWPVGIFAGQFDPDEIDGKLSAKLVGDVFAADTVSLHSFPTRPFEWDSNVQ